MFKRTQNTGACSQDHQHRYVGSAELITLAVLMGFVTLNPVQGIAQQVASLAGDTPIISDQPITVSKAGLAAFVAAGSDGTKIVARISHIAGQSVLDLYGDGRINFLINSVDTDGAAEIPVETAQTVINSLSNHQNIDEAQAVSLSNGSITLQ